MPSAATMASAGRSSRRRHRDTTVLGLYLAIGLLGATGGARPTGIGWVDAVLLGSGAVAAAACATRARTVPIYVAAGSAAVLQPATGPLALACVALVAALARRFRRGGQHAAALAGGLAWAATVGAPLEPAATPVAVPLVALGWLALSARRNGGRRFRGHFDRVAVAVAAVVVLCAGLGALAVVSARAHVERGADLAESGLEAAREGDTERAVDALRGARRALERGEARLGALWARPAWLVPGVSQNARALHRMVDEVHDLTAVGISTADAADLDALRASGGRVDLAAVRAIEQPLAEVLAELEATRTALAELDDDLLLPPVEDRLDQLRTELDDAVPSARLALDGVRAAPGLLGGEGPRTYLVLFTTPVESRARTGFPGNFAELTFTDGHVEMTRFGRISELNAALPPGGVRLDVPDTYLARYGRFEPGEEWRSLTYTPDFPTVARTAAQLYPASGGRAVDGVLSVDPVALAALLRFTGPVAVPGVGEPLDADSAARFLLRDQYVELPDNPERIDALEQLAEVTFERLTSVDLPPPRQLGEVLGPVVERGHLQLVTFAPEEASFLERLGVSGAFPEVAGDFVAVTTSNSAMNKIDLFLRRSLAYDVTWDPSTGALAATATITLTNEAPASGLPQYLLGNSVGANRPDGEDLPDGSNLVFVTLYTPWQPDGATLDGAPLPLEVLPELGRRAISTFVEIGPGASRTIEISLEGHLAQPRYLLDLVAQPLVVPEEASISIDVTGGADLDVTGPVDLAEGRATGRFPLVTTVRVTADPG